MPSPSARGENACFEWAVGPNIIGFVGFVGFVGFLAIGCPGLGHSRNVACRQDSEGKSQAITGYLSRNGIPLDSPLLEDTVVNVPGTRRPKGRPSQKRCGIPSI